MAASCVVAKTSIQEKDTLTQEQPGVLRVALFMLFDPASVGTLMQVSVLGVGAGRLTAGA
jgi:hypothetical protein